jgi:hypothetical protein
MSKCKHRTRFYNQVSSDWIVDESDIANLAVTFKSRDRMAIVMTGTDEGDIII